MSDISTIDSLLMMMLALIIMVLVLSIIYTYWRFTRIKHIYTTQARKRQGLVSRSFLLPSLSFSYRNHSFSVRATPGSKYRLPKTEVSTTVHHPSLSNMSVYREFVASKFGKLFGAHDVLLGFDEFDREYRVKADDELLVRRLLDYRVQTKLLEMMRQKPHVRLHDGLLHVYVHKVVYTEEEYDRLIDLACTLVDRIVDVK